MVGNGLRIGIESCLYDVDEATGVVIAKNESSRLAVTLPAEWHRLDGCRRIGILKEVDEERKERKDGQVYCTPPDQVDHHERGVSESGGLHSPIRCRDA